MLNVAVAWFFLNCLVVFHDAYIALFICSTVDGHLGYQLSVFGCI